MMQEKESPEIGFEDDPLLDIESGMESSDVEVFPVSVESAPAAPPPLEAFMNLRLPSVEAPAKPATEVKRPVDRLAKDRPTEGELERSHEIKHFDEPGEPGAASIGSLLAKIERGSGYGSGGYNQSNTTSPSTPLNPTRKAMLMGSYKPAMIFGFVAGLGLLVMLLLLGVVR